MLRLSFVRLACNCPTAVVTSIVFITCSISGGSRISQTGVPIPKAGARTCYFRQFHRSAWKWKKIRLREGPARDALPLGSDNVYCPLLLSAATVEWLKLLLWLGYPIWQPFYDVFYLVFIKYTNQDSVGIRLTWKLNSTNFRYGQISEPNVLEILIRLATTVCTKTSIWTIYKFYNGTY